MDATRAFDELVREREPNSWLNELEKLCAQRYDEDYRGLGVRKFYETKLAARKDHVREIRRYVESELFKEWENGVRSMHDLSRLVNALIGALDERLKAVDGRITKAKENEEVATKKVAANRTEWAKVGFLSQFLGKRRSLLHAQGECLRELYIYRTQFEAWNFAKRLLQDLITEFTRLGTDIQNCTALIDDGIKEFKDRIAQRCNDEKLDLRQSVVRLYKPEEVKEFAVDLDREKDVQSPQAQEVREALIEQLGENPSFAAFHSRIAEQRFFDVLEQKCEASAVAAHDNLIAVNKERSPLFGVNIVGTLRREYSGDEEGLRTFIHDLVSRAGNYLDFDLGEVNRVAPGIPTGVPTKLSEFMVIIPRAQEYAGFAEKLRGLFRQQVAGDIPVHAIESDTKPNEITLISVTNLFPLRYLKPLRFLKERYDIRLRQTDKPERIKLELHCEGDGTQHPDLYVTTDIKKYLPYIMLAKALQLIQPITNPVTGNTELYLVELDKDVGLENRVKLGKNLSDAFETLDVAVAQKFEDSIGKLLTEPDYRHREKRSALMECVREDLKVVLSERRGDIEDEVYKCFEGAARKAIQSLQATD